MTSTHTSAVVVFADIAGYTTLIQEDEGAALALLRRYKQIIFETAPRYGGEVVQYYGDGCLLVFESVLQAVQCARELQELYGQQPEIPVRTGIHIGEVVREEEHIYGATVNIASRIESMGLPGSVLLSSGVKDALGTQPELGFHSLGTFAFRHVDHPIEVFALTGGSLRVPAPEQMLGKGLAYQIDNSLDFTATSPLQVLVVEDDMIVGTHIAMVLGEAGYGVMGVIPSGEAALAQIQAAAPDLVLMDVNLRGKLDGIQTAEQIYLHHAIPVIFLTANADNATFDRAKSAFPYAFINKPFKPLALLRAIELVVQRIGEEQIPAVPPAQENPLPPALPQSDHVFVRDKDRMVKVKLSDIRYVEAERNYCRIHTQHRQYLLSTPMKAVESHLGDESFIRSHRSFVVNIAAIDGLDEHYLYIGEQAIPLSKAFKEDVYRRLNRI
ncbi:MAG: response regulator [Bacteroidetes bacterium]|nr:MAG: response regulator [Bacteroidota bacterium]